MTRVNPRLWLFALYAAAFCGLSYLLDPAGGFGSTALGGLIFAALMSGWIAMRQRFRQRRRNY